MMSGGRAINYADDIEYCDDEDSPDEFIQGSVIKIEFEGAGGADQSTDMEEESSPFPLPNQSDTLNRTSMADLSRKDNWKNLKTEIINRNKLQNQESIKPGAWGNVVKVIRSAPSSTVKFLGIEPSASRSNIANSPIFVNKTLNNWNERTFRVLNDNPVFGGKLKEKALDNYINVLDEDLVGETDPFYNYKIHGEPVDLDKKVSVAGIAMNGIRKVMVSIN